jgi:heme/copper-type cytochrome/quinol oxidase subunit 2
MSRRQRFTFLAIAVVIAVVAAVVLADTSEDDDQPSQTAATATPTPTGTPTPPGEETATATPTPTPTPKPPPLLTAGEVTQLDFTEGETVRFRARSDVDEEVHVHGYDIAKDAPAGQTITMSFKATIPGIFEIEFEDAGEEIGKLKVDTG